MRYVSIIIVFFPFLLFKFYTVNLEYSVPLTVVMFLLRTVHKPIIFLSLQIL